MLLLQFQKLNASYVRHIITPEQMQGNSPSFIILLSYLDCL